MASTSSNFRPYPHPGGSYEDVVSDPKLFMETLEKLHATMGTKFMIPIIGGKELDLHRLFHEVTSRGGIEKILKDRRWKEITAVFNFPSTATNASFVLRKYYYSLLHHFEQIYYFKAGGFIPGSGENLQSPSGTPVSAQRSETLQSSPKEPQATVISQTPTIEQELPGERTPPWSSSGTPVVGVIDGKFDNGYLVSVTIGSEKLMGVLYQGPENQPHGPSQQIPFGANPKATAATSSAATGVHRRKRRKKSEIKRRDPAHPKPNRSGYNFFFAEQHARLKPLHPGKDRDISKMIGEGWSKLTESERVVYQEKADQDKERYRIEMEGYRERLRTGQVISDAVPLRQRFPEQGISIVGPDSKIGEPEGEEEEDDSPQTLDNEKSLSESEEEYQADEERQAEEGTGLRKMEESSEKGDAETREANFGIEETKEEEQEQEEDEDEAEEEDLNRAN